MNTALPLPPPAEWMREAACVGLVYDGVDPWHSEIGDGLITIAKKICARCPVSAACFEYGMALPDPRGIWGGRSAQAAKLKARTAGRK